MNRSGHHDGISHQNRTVNRNNSSTKWSNSPSEFPFKWWIEFKIINITKFTNNKKEIRKQDAVEIMCEMTVGLGPKSYTFTPIRHEPCQRATPVYLSCPSYVVLLFRWTTLTHGQGIVSTNRAFRERMNIDLALGALPAFSDRFLSWKAGQCFLRSSTSYGLVVLILLQTKLVFVLWQAVRAAPWTFTTQKHVCFYFLKTPNTHKITCTGPRELWLNC